MNANKPAFPRPASEYTESGTLADGNQAVRPQDGLTKREYAAIQIVAAMCSDSVGAASIQQISESSGQPPQCLLATAAVAVADAVLAELAKGEGK